MKKLNKSVALILAVVLLVGSIAGTTMAWLIDSTDDVVNTFTYGDIDIKLDETDTNEDGDNDPNTNEYEMMPGQDIAKDPKVTVEAGSEDNWLFVKLVKSENFDKYLTYTIGEGWTQLMDASGAEVEGVYYRFQGAIAEDGEDAVYSVLKEDKVTVLGTVTKEDLNALDPEGQTATYPKLTITAYAAQYVGFEPEISEGAEEATPVQVNAAALKVWNEVVVPGTTEAPEEETTAPVVQTPAA